MYELLPFQFTRFENDVIIVNEAGVFHCLSASLFDRLVRHTLEEDESCFLDLKSKLFIVSLGESAHMQASREVALQKMAARLRSRKAFLREFTSLHMLVITLRCNQRCAYCQASSAEQGETHYDMSVETARKIVDIVFTAPGTRPKLEFQGGEPLLNWPVIEAVVPYAEELAVKTGKTVSFVICTNLVGITRRQLEFCRDHHIAVSTSLDGPEELHNACRVMRTGEGSYQNFLQKLELAREVLGNDGVDALMTTTAFSINRLEDVVDEYIRLGMNGIFIRSLNPYGFASERAQMLGYKTELFVERYFAALRHIMKWNHRIFFPEYFATLLFSRILTPFATGFVDLQSPAGTGISGVIYDYDGSVFPSDEARMLARMGDRHFYLGNVWHDSYEQIFNGKSLRRLIASSCVETTFPCAWCAFQAYCGTDPVRNYLESGGEARNMTGSPFCKKHKLMFSELFKMLKNMSSDDEAIVWSWIMRNPALGKRHENI